MKTGLSSYSLSRAIGAGEMDIFQAIEWIAENGGEHVEIVPIGFSVDDQAQAQAIADKAQAVGIDVSSYTIGANLLHDNAADRQQEIDRLKCEVDIAHALGVKLMRHDVASRPIPECTMENFLADLPSVADGCREVAEHAKQYDIVTSMENHGYHFQGSERVQQLLKAVDHSHFKTTLDIGNFMCADEDSVAATKNNMPFASMVHIKDFYLRNDADQFSEGWFPTRQGRKLRGAIVGHGDIDMPNVFKAIRSSGYDGYLSVEFEGMEECRLGSKVGMDNVKVLWGNAG